MNNGSGADVAGSLFAGGVLMMGLIVGVVLYIIFSIPIYQIAKNQDHPLPWLAFVPLANLWLLFELGGMPGWLAIVAIVVSIIPILGALACLALILAAWWKVAERQGHPGWIALLLLIPLINIAVPFYIAYAKPARAIL